MAGELAGRVALVTGGCSGIGRAMTLALVHEASPTGNCSQSIRRGSVDPWRAPSSSTAILWS